MSVSTKSSAQRELFTALRASEARFHSIVDRSADGVLVVGGDGGIRFVNPAAEALLGRKAEELYGEIFGVPLVPGEVVEIDLWQEGGAGRVTELRVVATQWQGEPAHLATLRDVTERKRREEEAQEALRCRDRFLATLSHELRNPLAAISAASSVLQAQPAADPRTNRAREVIERESKLMARLLDDLLDVCRVSRGKAELRKEPLELGMAVVQAAQLAAPRLEQAGVKFHVALPAAVLNAEADPLRLQQIVVNLLNNAAKYTEPGGDVWLAVAKQDGLAEIRVRDSGIGIAADKLEEIFDPFVQAPVGPTKAASGLGIGLSLVRSFVELHGGRVEAYSEGPGRGSEFVVHWPLADAPPPAATPEPVAEPPMPAAELRILLVEDNPAAREMLKMLLELDGHEVETAADGLRGAEMIEFQQPDVALIDIGLPEFDGYQVAQRIRANRRNDGVYLIAQTGYGLPEDRRRALAAGFDAHLVKPIDPQDLARLLAEKVKPRKR